MGTALAERKKEIRREALRKRDSLTDEQRRAASGKIVRRLTEQLFYREADAVLTYISFRSEVDTFPLLERAFADGKAVFAPKVFEKEMAFFRIFSSADLTAGYRGILEPAGGRLFERRRDDPLSQRRILLCMPGAAFDRARHRIGYGGGFYDRYLSELLDEDKDGKGAVCPEMKITTAALSFSCQIFEEIPWEAHDFCPERIVTETEIL